MKLQGIKTEYTPKGKIKKITINANTKSELVEDIIDTITYERHKNEERIPWEGIKERLDQKHKIKP